MKTRAYDPRCLDLAQYFLRDLNERFPGRVRAEMAEADRLAMAIQVIVEDFIAELQEEAAE